MTSAHHETDAVLGEDFRGRVVIVGDEAPLLEVSVSVLGLDGHQAQVVGTMQEALEIAEQQGIDLIQLTAVCSLPRHAALLASIVRAFERAIPVHVAACGTCAKRLVQRMQETGYPAFFTPTPWSLDPLRETTWRALRYGWALRLQRAAAREVEALHTWCRASAEASFENLPDLDTAEDLEP